VPPAQAPAINQMHSWKVKVATPDGTPVHGAVFGVGGGMPQHGHGLPTQPRVTREVADGTYQLDGMKFSMTGWWEVKLDIQGPARHRQGDLQHGGRQPAGAAVIRRDLGIGLAVALASCRVTLTAQALERLPPRDAWAARDVATIASMQLARKPGRGRRMRPMRTSSAPMPPPSAAPSSTTRG
jgi:hypothetical protein